jgi:hypothetical protein
MKKSSQNLLMVAYQKELLGKAEFRFTGSAPVAIGREDVCLEISVKIEK